MACNATLVFLLKICIARFKEDAEQVDREVAFSWLSNL
jgi:hypothetical protein